MPSIGGFLGDTLGSAISSGFDIAMKAIWQGAMWIFRTAFEIADQVSVFHVSTTDGPVAALWPMMLWVSGMLALGLFFVQLISASLRGGRGFFRTVTGPVQYGLALGLSVTFVGLLLAAADGLTLGILEYGLRAKNFQDAMHGSGLMDVSVDIAKPVVLGYIALFGLLPVGIGYILEMLFRQAAVLTLITVLPVVAAGLTARISAGWYWRTARWLIAAVAIKPALALTTVLGFGVFGSADGIKELIVGCGILLISLLSPFVLFRLLAFVDPNTDAGAAFRDWLSAQGIDSYPGNVPDPRQPPWSRSGGDGAGEEDEAVEDAHTGRFDEVEVADDDGSGTDPSAGSGSCPDDSSPGSGGSNGDMAPETSDSDGGRIQESWPWANRGRVVSTGTSNRGQNAGGDVAGDSSGTGGSPPGGAAAGGAEEAAVIL